jgi:hypothetical protein
MKKQKDLKYGIFFKGNEKEYKKRQSAARRLKKPIDYLLSQCKYRARIEDKEFNLTKEELVIPEICPVFNIPLFFTPGKRTYNSFSIDRRDNSKGYTKENVRVISWKANMYKGDLTIEEVENLLRYMKGEAQ